MTLPPRSRNRVRFLSVLVGSAGACIGCVQRPTPAVGSLPKITASERVVVRVRDLGLSSGVASPNILVFADPGARVALGSAEPVALGDTLHLHHLPAMTLDVTEGAVHLQLISLGTMSLGGDVTAGQSAHWAATGRHITILKGGTGVQVDCDNGRCDGQVKTW